MPVTEKKVHNLGVKTPLLISLRNGTKTLEIRLRTPHFDDFAVGHEILFNNQVRKKIVGIRYHANFIDMLEREDHTKIAPGRSLRDVKEALFRLYQRSDHQLGVIVFELGEVEDVVS